MEQLKCHSQTELYQKYIIFSFSSLPKYFGHKSPSLLEDVCRDVEGGEEELSLDILVYIVQTWQQSQHSSRSQGR